MTFRFTAPTASEATRVATAYAQQFTAFRHRLDTEALDSAGRDVAAQMARLRAQGMASWNPDKALAMTQSITDPNMRAVTMGSVAERIAGDDSGRAMQLLDQAQKTAGDSQDLKTELQLVASRAEVAQATNNDAMVRDSLRKGFEIGDQLLRQEQDNNQGQVSWYMLGSLVQTGIKSDPDLTLAYINSFSLPYVRAELLMDAAQALRFGDSHGSRRRLRATHPGCRWQRVGRQRLLDVHDQGLADLSMQSLELVGDPGHHLGRGSRWRRARREVPRRGQWLHQGHSLLQGP